MSAHRGAPPPTDVPASEQRGSRQPEPAVSPATHHAALGRAMRRAARHGVRDTLPVLAAYTPFALTLGAALASTSVDPWVAWSSSALMFGGAAQLGAVQLLDQHAAVAVVVLTALVINARHLLYSASLARHTQDWPARWRWTGAHLLADPVYALAIARFDGPDGGADRHTRLGYYLGVGVSCFLAWQLLTGAGAVLGNVLPDRLPLPMAAPLTFLLLLLPMLKDRAGYVAAGVGGLTALAAAGLPLGLGLLAGAATGITAGAAVGGRHA